MSGKSAPFAHRNLPLLLLQARERVLARFRPLLNANGLTEQQWRILRGLYEAGPLEPREIGRHFQISSPSLTGVLARMDELGLVKRERMEHDQRRQLVSLTPRSRALIARMVPRIEARYRELQAELGVPVTRELYALLDQVVAALGSEQAAESEQT